MNIKLFGYETNLMSIIVLITSRLSSKISCYGLNLKVLDSDTSLHLFIEYYYSLELVTCRAEFIRN
jgi:hypothetical protein